MQRQHSHTCPATPPPQTVPCLDFRMARFSGKFCIVLSLLWRFEASKGRQKTLRTPLIPEKNIKDFFDDDRLRSFSNVCSQQAPIFRTDGKVKITIIRPSGSQVSEHHPRGNHSPGQVQGCCLAWPGPEMVHSDFLAEVSSNLLPLPVSPERHRDIIPIPSYDEASWSMCNWSQPAWIIQEVFWPFGLEGVHLSHPSPSSRWMETNCVGNSCSTFTGIITQCQHENLFKLMAEDIIYTKQKHQ